MTKINKASQPKQIVIDRKDLWAAFDQANKITSPGQWDKNVGKCSEKWGQWRRTDCWLNAPEDVRLQMDLDSKKKDSSIQTLTKEEFKDFNDTLKSRYGFALALDFDSVAKALDTPGLVTKAEIDFTLQGMSNVKLK
jgi:hypothetical protein